MQLRFPLVAALVIGGAGAGRSATPSPPLIRLIDVTEASGLRFVHRSAPTAEKYLPETMGAGVALLDHDLDGDLDIYLVQGRAVVGAADPEAANQLWRNDGGLRFAAVPEAAGAGDLGLGQGVCVGDVEADGDPDLFVTNHGPDALFLNQGDGTFRPSPPLPDTARHGWSTSCTFLDADGDGHLDVYVVRYVDFDPVRRHPTCGDVQAGVRAYCHPDVFSGVGDRLYRGDGTGRFRDVTHASGLSIATGKGLGVIATDIDRDGDQDILVANDSTANHLLVNDGRGHFRDTALISGFAYDERGTAEAGMGIVSGDVDGDGLPDVFLTHLDLQTNTLYLQGPPGRFRDATAGSGLGEASLGLVGFGVELWDPDLDGDLDLAIANGHVIDNIAHFNSALTHAQPDQLLWNDGTGRFRLAGTESGELGDAPLVGRGSAAGDLDGDGDLDLVITANGGPVRLFRNVGGERRGLIVLELTATRSHREALGARVELRAPGTDGRAGERLSAGEVQGGRSYLSDGTRRLHLACPAGEALAVVVWPSGAREVFGPLPTGGGYRLVEGLSAGPPPRLPGAPHPPAQR